MMNANLEFESTRTSDLPKTDVTADFAVPVWLAVTGATVLGSAIPVALHFSRHGVLNVHQIALAFFFSLNAIIAFWEICLFFRIDFIQGQYEEYRERYRGRELDRVIEFFTAKLPPARLFSPSRWAEVWSSYSLFDGAYADKQSFGFFIDIANGFSTLIPSLVIPYAITFELIPARALGIVGLVLCYQMLFGALVYLTSFIVNQRYRGHSLRNVLLFVGLSNSIWTVFPLWAIGVSIWMIYHDSFSIFGS